MPPIDWNALSATGGVASALIAVWALNRTVRLSALSALEQRFSQINVQKMSQPHAWDDIFKLEAVKGAAAHLIFETFQFYHHAFLLRKDRWISERQFQPWRARLA